MKPANIESAPSQILPRAISSRRKLLSGTWGASSVTKLGSFWQNWEQIDGDIRTREMFGRAYYMLPGIDPTPGPSDSRLGRSAPSGSRARCAQPVRVIRRPTHSRRSAASSMPPSRDVDTFSRSLATSINYLKFPLMRSNWCRDQTPPVDSRQGEHGILYEARALASLRATVSADEFRPEAGVEHPRHQRARRSPQQFLYRIQ
jgi:hypothetical protein